MKYQGGKTLISKPVSEIIVAAVTAPNTPFVSLFCGALSVESRVAANKNIGAMYINDKHPYLTLMYHKVLGGYELPDTITQEEYQYIRENQENDIALAAFVGFACSFGGKWFGGYGRGKKANGEPRNYCDEGKRGLLKKLEPFKGAKVTWSAVDYRDVVIPDGAIVYADPPYHNTTGYAIGEKFDSVAFWEYMRELSNRNIVYISEQEAPDDFEAVWERKVTRTLNRDKSNQKKATEKVFKWKGAGTK